MILKLDPQALRSFIAKYCATELPIYDFLLVFTKYVCHNFVPLSNIRVRSIPLNSTLDVISGVVKPYVPIYCFLLIFNSYI